MKILHAIQGLPVAAGTTTFVAGVANESARMGHDVTVAVYCEPAPHDRALFDASVKVVSMPSIIDRPATESTRFDVVHIHSMWNIWLHRVAVWCRKNEIPYVCSPHGSATPWAMRYKAWKKWTVWWLYQRRDFRKAVALHVTVPTEQTFVRRLGMKNPVIVAPLGVALPPVKTRVDDGRTRRVFLFVSRVQKVKGLDNLIRAVSELRKSGVSDGQIPLFRIVGPDQENHTAELKLLAHELGVEKDFEFAGPRYGDELSAEYERADVFVLPSRSENFSAVVADALAHAVPVITTKGTPWSEIEEFNCGWWVDVGIDPLLPALKSAMACSESDLIEMGRRGRKLIEKRYSWSRATADLIAGYQRVLVEC